MRPKRSTAIPPRGSTASPASSARRVVRAHADAEHGELGGVALAAGLDRRQPAALVGGEALDRGAADQLHALGDEVLAGEVAERLVELRGQHPVLLLDHRDLDSPPGQRLGHLDPDQSRADDHRPLDRVLREELVQLRRVAQVVEALHALGVDPGEWRAHGEPAGGQDELVVGNPVGRPAGVVAHLHLAPLAIDGEDLAPVRISTPLTFWKKAGVRFTPIGVSERASMRSGAPAMK